MLVIVEDLNARAAFDPVAAVTAASKGDQRAWDTIVTQYSSLVWAVARSHRLSDSDAADVYQGTWLRLVENLGGIRDAERIGAWLCTTARRESLALIRRRDRDLPVADTEVLDGETGESVDDRLLRSEENRALWQAFGRLGESCQRLLRLVFTDPPPSYAEVSAALDIPIGSIGPTRARCLASLQTLLGRTTSG
jgi:RNA polymerase sigma factor (sigma-70 family)